MKRLNKSQATEWTAIRAHFEEAHAAYRAALEDARSFRDGVIEEMDEYANGRDEFWPESPDGILFADWRTFWDDLDLDDPEDPYLEDVPEGVQP